MGGIRPESLSEPRVHIYELFLRGDTGQCSAKRLTVTELAPAVHNREVCIPITLPRLLQLLRHLAAVRAVGKDDTGGVTHGSGRVENLDEHPFVDVAVKNLLDREHFFGWRLFPAPFSAGCHSDT